MTTPQPEPQRFYYPPQPYPPPQAVFVYPVQQPVERQSRLALAGFILGIMSMLCAPVLVGLAIAPFAIGFGIAGLHVTKTYAYLKGREFAWIGIGMAAATLIGLVVLGIIGSYS